MFSPFVCHSIGYSLQKVCSQINEGMISGILTYKKKYEIGNVFFYCYFILRRWNLFVPVRIFPYMLAELHPAFALLCSVLFMFLFSTLHLSLFFYFALFHFLSRLID